MSVLASLLPTPWAVWTIVALAVAGLVARPFGWPDYVWGVAGAALLVLLRLLSPGDAWAGILRGTDVYLFLVGMMLLSELARQEGLFGWLAARAVRLAAGSATRLFGLVYAVGTVVTVFLSNDATAVVLTPAVAAVARAAHAKDPLPYLFVCAFVANAASFVLPISNPANLVIYGSHMPALPAWLPRYALPSALAIVATYALLRWSQRVKLRQDIARHVAQPVLSTAGRVAAVGIVATAVVLLAASGFGLDLGLPTFLAGAATAGLVLAFARASPMGVVRGVSWGVLPLVAGLFVLVEALDRTGVIGTLADLMRGAVQQSTARAAWASGPLVAIVANLVNNLPAGLVAGRVVELADVPDGVRRAVLIGIDLGPNLSVTGSLATILWLTALRRENIDVGAWRFLRLGAVVMPPALLLALAGALAIG